jgi:ABC-2 type transport system permease protein
VKYLHLFSREFSLIKAVAVSTYKEWAAYKSHMALTIIITPLGLIIQYFIWSAVYNNRTSFKGFSLNQMLLYYVVSAVISLIVFDFAEWNLQMLIHTGKLTTFMLRPMVHMRFALYQKIGHRLLSLWIEVIPVALISVLVLHIYPVTANIFWSAISVILGFFMTFFINYSIGIIAFWVVKNGSLRGALGIISSLSAGVYFPLVLFPHWLQNVMFILPFQYMTYVPVCVFIGSYKLGNVALSIPQIVLVQVIAVILMYIISKILWHFGSKKYMGVGV